ncbi:MAG TPA: ATP-dependent DNA helicase [Kineosporiaceae bacterium]
MTEQLELGFDSPPGDSRPPVARRAPGRHTAGAATGPAAGAPPARYGAVELAHALGRPEPTPEQVAVIEAPVEPMLVVAGAGSGKTETMAARVVWLVANGHAEPEEILGLTFTRKAAGELAERVRARLRTLYRRGLLGSRGEPGAPGTEPQPVAVSTYHAYSAALVVDHGLRLGVEPGARLLGEAGAWQLVAELVERWDGDMSGVDRTPTTVTESVLALAGECAEHLVEPGDVDALIGTIVERALAVPDEVGAPGPGRPRAPVRERLERLGQQRRLVPLVEAYVRRKRELEVLDFGDQVALAARLARDVEEVGAGERARYRVVLLDEYQDTSHAQLVLLRSLFGGGHPVVAVGDPHQSIYGWRGASAGNLQRFPEDFRRASALDGDGAGAPATTCYLSTSWRNDVAILGVANGVSAELRVPAPWTAGREAVAVPPLRARPHAEPGAVRVAWLATLEDEARVVAEVMEREWRSASPPPSSAVLCRARAQFPLVDAALRARGLPVEVVGLGGLLAQPEVADLRAALEVLHDPTRGDSLMRLLTGPALRVGPRDLQALGAWAAERARSRAADHDVPPHGVPSPGVEVEHDAVDERSIVDALDALPPPGWCAAAGDLEFSDAARSRLDRFAGVLRDLRGRLGLPLPDLVLDVERALLLDVEVAARPGVRPAVARAHLDAFVDVAAGFAAGGDTPGLGAFLAWLAAADVRERGLDTPLAEVRKDAVQVLTVHASKGLEWDVVAVAGLAEGTFPAGRSGRSPAASNGWLGDLGALPYPLRGDASGLPRWEIGHARTQKEVQTALETFRAQCGLHEVAEERRLAYVAVTRSRRLLLLTGAVWGNGSTPREPSRFLLEAADLPGVVRLDWQDPVVADADNPREALAPTAPWPRDVLGERRPVVEAAALLVRDAMADRAAGEPAGPGERVVGPVGDAWSREIDLLLAERDDAGHRRLQVPLPAHLSASRVVALARDPAALALRLRRPTPEPPNPHARRGSAFHAWLERRFGVAALVDVDELPGAADDAAADEALAALQECFLASAWADRVPEAVEVSIETPVAGVIVRGRIDAVYRSAGATPEWEVVDWKTGPPSSGRAAAAAAVQLAIYRLAWSRLTGTELAQVGAAFFHASTGVTVRPVDLLDEAGLVDLITAAVGLDPRPGATG